MNDGPAKPRPRWPSYSLRSFFVILTAVCLWLGWNVNLVQQRNRLREQSRAASEDGTSPKFRFVSDLSPPTLPNQPTAADEKRYVFQTMEHRRHVYWKKTVASPPSVAKGISRLRRWLGDQDVELILVFDKANFEQARELFPEAYICPQ